MFPPSTSGRRPRWPSQRVCPPDGPSPLRLRCSPSATKYKARTHSKDQRRGWRSTRNLMPSHPPASTGKSGSSRLFSRQYTWARAATLRKAAAAKKWAAICSCCFSAPRPVFRAFWKSLVSQELAYWRAQTGAWAKSGTGWSQSSHYRLGPWASGATGLRPARCSTASGKLNSGVSSASRNVPEACSCGPACYRPDATSTSGMACAPQRASQRMGFAGVGRARTQTQNIRPGLPRPARRPAHHPPAAAHIAPTLRFRGKWFLLGIALRPCQPTGAGFSGCARSGPMCRQRE